MHREAALGGPLAEPVARLHCFRGIDTLSALALHLEVHDWRRVGHAPQLAAWLDLAPSLNQSGIAALSGLGLPGRRTGAAGDDAFQCACHRLWLAFRS